MTLPDMHMRARMMLQTLQKQLVRSFIKYEVTRCMQAVVPNLRQNGTESLS